MRNTTSKVCENCGDRTTAKIRIRNCKASSERRPRKKRLCEKCAKRWDRYGRLENRTPSVNPEQLKAIKRMHAAGKGPVAIGRELGLCRMLVSRRIEKLSAG